MERIVDGYTQNSLRTRMKENRSFRSINIRFVTALDLIKCLKKYYKNERGEAKSFQGREANFFSENFPKNPPPPPVTAHVYDPLIMTWINRR